MTTFPDTPPNRQPDAELTLLRHLADAMLDAVVTVDRDWNFTFANQRALAIVNRESIVGHNIFKLFPGNYEEPFYSTYKTAMEQGTPGSFEAFHTAPLNLWLRVEAKPFAAGGIIVFFSDISSRKSAEEREQATAARLAEVLAVTSDAILTLDREWRYTFLNAAAQRLIDPTYRLLGLNMWEEFPMVEGTPGGDLMRRAMEHHKSGSVETFYPEPLNVWLSLQVQPAPDGIVIFFRDITAQRNHDAIVRAQQDTLAAVQRAARVVTWDLNLATEQIHYGQGSFSLSGHSSEELATLSAIERIVPDSHTPDLRATIAEAVRTREMVVLEFPLVAADGHVIWVESRGQAAPAADGTMHLRGMSIDVTQRKLDEQQLVASQERYRVLADLNPLAIWMGNAAGAITYANQGFLTFLGLTIEELSDTGWLLSFAPLDRDRILAAWLFSVRTGELYDEEALLRHAATGKYRYWHLRASPLRDADGQIVSWLGVASDVHESRMAATTLRAEQAESERKRAELETIYATTPVGLALFDPVTFRFLNCNEHEAQMIGLPREEVIGSLLQNVAPPDKIPALLSLMRHVAAGNHVRDELLEGELPFRPGEKRAWSVNYSPVFADDGSVRAISSATIEITNQKRAEAALVQSEKLAAVGRLASSISHEINNPLEAITNLLYLVAGDENLPDDVKLYVHMAQSELSRVSQIATQTLRFHRQAVNATHVSPEELVGAVLRLYTGRLLNSSIKVDARYSTHTRVLCFENDIRQVLNNLIANAIDAMRSGGRLVVRAHAAHDYRGPEPRSGIRLTIADTGHGMSPQVVARIFEPFYTTKDLQGTGLGLWISHGIVERHQGRLTVRSSTHPTGHGTIFSLFLPCEER